MKETASILLQLWDELNVPISELLEKLQVEGEKNLHNKLNKLILSTLSEWIYNIHSSEINKEEIADMLTKIESFTPEEFNHVENGNYFVDTVISLQLSFKKEELHYGTYLIGYLLGKDKKVFKAIAKLFSSIDDVPDNVRAKILEVRAEPLSDGNYEVSLYNNKKSFGG